MLEETGQWGHAFEGYTLSTVPYSVSWLPGCLT
jgi:hypothetical protein